MSRFSHERVSRGVGFNFKMFCELRRRDDERFISSVSPVMVRV